jgi:hypothetical protein
MEKPNKKGSLRPDGPVENVMSKIWLSVLKMIN